MSCVYSCHYLLWQFHTLSLSYAHYNFFFISVSDTDSHALFEFYNIIILYTAILYSLLRYCFIFFIIIMPTSWSLYKKIAMCVRWFVPLYSISENYNHYYYYVYTSSLLYYNCTPRIIIVIPLSFWHSCTLNMHM